ncbi:MAG: tetratricopeptide repeat protein [bacterium]
MKKKAMKHSFLAVILVIGVFVFTLNPVLGEDLFQEGLRYYFRGELQEAQENFTQAVEDQPENARYLFFLGNTFYRLDQFSDAEEAYRRVMELDSNYTPARKRLAELYIEQENWKEAEKQFEKLLEEEPQDFEHRLNLGIILFQTEKFDRARDQLLKAREIQPGEPEVHFYLGRIALQRREYLSAVSRLQRAIELNPSAGIYYFYRGLARFHNEDYLSQNDADWNSASDFRRALDMGADSPRSRFMLANSFLNRGLFSLRENNLERGVDQLRSAVEEYRKVLSGDWSASNAYHNMGVAYLGIGNLELARRAVEEAVAEEPTTPFFHDTLGEIYFRQGKFNEALEAWNLVIELEPDYKENPFADLLELRSLSDRRREARIRK